MSWSGWYRQNDQEKCGISADSKNPGSQSLFSSPEELDLLVKCYKPFVTVHRWGGGDASVNIFSIVKGLRWAGSFKPDEAIMIRLLVML